MLLLDSDILIDFQRGHPACRAWFASLSSPPSVPGFVVMELVQSAANAAQVRSSLRQVAPLPIVWASDSDCAHALSTFARYHLSHGLGLLDSLIAACAIGAGAELCTFNLKHFRAVPGLRTLQPYAK